MLKDKRKESIKMSKIQFSHKWIILVIIPIASLCSTQIANAVDPSTEHLWLSNPYWRAGRIEWNEGGFDAAGFSDKFWWGTSPRHNFTEHEMLWGEWAAAIYYDGIATAPKAMWLTDKFVFPDWITNSDFYIWGITNQWNDPANPVVGYDTGYSSIRNGQVIVTIDYEMVDLGQQGPNGEGGSPMAFGTFQGRPAYVRSERYVLLQTYTITNMTQGNRKVERR